MKYALFGGGGHANSLISGHYDDLEIVAIYDDTVLEHPLYSGDFATMLVDYKDKQIDKIHVAIGDNTVRKEVYERLMDQLGNEAIGNLVSKYAHIYGSDVSQCKGVFIGAHTYIGPQVVIGDFSIINTAALIEHDCQIGSTVFIGPHAALGGNVSIEDDVFVGINATIINGVSISSAIVIGAGAAVIKDLTVSGTYVGVPASLI